jgi:polar amino acid transport system substrate-binding protein
MTIDSTLLNAFAPTGKLRASINLGNPLLANRNAATGEPGGISVDLAREFAARLGIEAELTAFDTASKSVEAVTTETADIGFFAIDPVRGARSRRRMC